MGADSVVATSIEGASIVIVAIDGGMRAISVGTGVSGAGIQIITVGYGGTFLVNYQ